MITVVGSANIDLLSVVPHLPLPGETVLATGYGVAAGGKGANQAVAAARAGSEVQLLARVGSDDYGNALIESLSGAGVGIDAVLRDATAPTGVAHIAVDPQGENAIVVVPGANALLTPEDVDAAIDIIRRSSILVVQLEIPIVTVRHALSLARNLGVRTVLNPAPARELSPDVVRAADILVPNEGELATISGMGSPVDPLTVARLIVGTGCAAVVVTLGADGAIVVTNGHSEEIDAPAVDSIDTTGAGDAFIGNLVHRLDAGHDLNDAARFACFAAALSTTVRGAQQSMPGAAQTEALIRDSAP